MAHHSEWGPSGLIVEQIIRKVPYLSGEELVRLENAWVTEPGSVDDAWGYLAAAAAIRDRGLYVARAAHDAATAATDVIRASGERAAHAVGAVRDAAYAAALVDLTGSFGLLSEHIEAIMGPWLLVIGDPRIDPVCHCDTPPVTLDLGPLAPQPGDRFPWLVMEVEVGWLEPHIVGYAATPADALNLADKVTGPVVMWRAGKEHS